MCSNLLIHLLSYLSVYKTEKKNYWTRKWLIFYSEFSAFCSGFSISAVEFSQPIRNSLVYIMRKLSFFVILVSMDFFFGLGTKPTCCWHIIHFNSRPSNWYILIIIMIIYETCVLTIFDLLTISVDSFSVYVSHNIPMRHTIQTIFFFWIIFISILYTHTFYFIYTLVNLDMVFPLYVGYFYIFFFLIRIYLININFIRIRYIFCLPFSREKKLDFFDQFFFRSVVKMKTSMLFLSFNSMLLIKCFRALLIAFLR